MRPVLLVIAIAVLASSACIPGLSEPLDFGDLNLCPSVSRVTIDPPSVTLRVGDQQSLAVMAIDKDGNTNILCGDPTWSSSNPAAATVSAGTVTGVGAGTTWIRATLKGKTDSARVTMSTATLKSVSIEPSTLEVLVGQTHSLAVTARDSAGNVLPVRRVTWSSSATAVAGVTSKGTVVALGAGNAEIRAVIEGMTASMPITTTRNAPSVKFLQMAPGVEHSCALVGGGAYPDGTAYCWGNGGSGRLGTNDVSSRSAPTRVSTALTFASITTGGQHTCANTTAGEVYCWGSNLYGQLGDGTTADRALPTRVTAPAALHDVVASVASTCGLAQNGAAYCWGSWANRNRSNVVALAGGLTFVQLTAGASYVCGLTGEGRVYCWGGFLDEQQASPALVSGNVTFASIDAGDVTLCGIGTDHYVYCWGINTGSFWDSAVGKRQSPVAVPGSGGFETLATGGGFVCGTTSTDTMCLGTLVGTPSTAPYSMQRVSRGAEHPFLRLAGGTRHGCAIDRVGGGWCWGGNEALQVGVSAEVSTQVPRQLVIR